MTRRDFLVKPSTPVIGTEIERETSATPPRHIRETFAKLARHHRDRSAKNADFKKNNLPNQLVMISGKNQREGATRFMPQVGKSGKIHRDTTAKHSRNQSATEARHHHDRSAKNADFKKNNLVNQVVTISRKNLARRARTRFMPQPLNRRENPSPWQEISIIISNLKKYKFF